MTLLSPQHVTSTNKRQQMVQPHRSCKTELGIKPIALQREPWITASVYKHTTSPKEALSLDRNHLGRQTLQQHMQIHMESEKLVENIKGLY